MFCRVVKVRGPQKSSAGRLGELMLMSCVSEDEYIRRERGVRGCEILAVEIINAANIIGSKEISLVGILVDKSKFCWRKHGYVLF